MKRAHRVALAPTPEQEVRFGQHAGYARFAYNWALGEFRAGLQVGEWLNHQSLRPRWNRVKGIIAPWAAPLSQNAAKYAVIRPGRWGGKLGRLSQAVEGWASSRAAGGLPQVQAAKARAGLPG